MHKRSIQAIEFESKRIFTLKEINAYRIWFISMTACRHFANHKLIIRKKSNETDFARIHFEKNKKELNFEFNISECSYSNANRYLTHTPVSISY